MLIIQMKTIVNLLLKCCIINTLIRTPSMNTVLTLRTKAGHHLRTSFPKAGDISPSKCVYDLLPFCVSQPTRCCHLHTSSVATCPGLWVICALFILCFLIIALSLSHIFCFYVFLASSPSVLLALHSVPHTASFKKPFSSLYLLFLTYYTFQFPTP